MMIAVDNRKADPLWKIIFELKRNSAFSR